MTREESTCQKNRMNCASLLAYSTSTLLELNHTRMELQKEQTGLSRKQLPLCLMRPAYPRVSGGMLYLLLHTSTIDPPLLLSKTSLHMNCGSRRNQMCRIFEFLAALPMCTSSQTRENSLNLIHRSVSSLSTHLTSKNGGFTTQTQRKR